MIRRILTGLLMLLIATPALALSCLRPDVRTAFVQAQEAEETYIVVHGTLSFDASKLPEAVLNDSPPVTRIAARLMGMGLTETGFDVAFERDVTLEVLCFGPWCGGAGDGARYLAFLRQDGAGYVVSADPCASLLFHEPKPEDLTTVAQCYKAGHCTGE